ncbi:MAG: hypothetical protein LBD77_01195 [Bifidobacteriaceae bacterium]|jgi:hypothetical protein|nr:hypothetical protein [Bifidobacteriaceae bacterium]
MPNPSDDIGRRIAPHIDARWSDNFITELRLSGTGGTAIGAALAEAESHVAASGLTAQEVFGDPRAYAQALDPPASADQSPRAIAGSLWPVLVQLIGLWLALGGARGLGAGEPARFGLGLVVLIGLTATAPWTGTWCLRLFFDHPVRGFLVWWAAFLAVLLPEALIPLNLPAPAAVTAAVGAGALACGAVAAWRVGRHKPLEDPVSAPTGYAQSGAASHGRGFKLAPLAIPAAAAVLAPIIWLIA